MIAIGKGDEQEKDNRLTMAFKRFEDFKLMPGESIAAMETRFLKVLIEENDLGKEIS